MIDGYAIINNDYKEKTYNVDNMYLCINDKNRVGLYKRYTYYNKYILTKLNSDYYDSGFIFVGIDSDDVGIIKTHYHKIPTFSKAAIGDKKLHCGLNYVATCKIEDYVNFDMLRLKMIEEGIINNYKLGPVTETEMLEVLKYACKYFTQDEAEKVLKKNKDK